MNKLNIKNGFEIELGRIYKAIEGIEELQQERLIDILKEVYVQGFNDGANNAYGNFDLKDYKGSN